jgi:hypothetical protein
MEYQVTFHKDNHDEDEKYNGHIEIKLNFHHLKINWIISDCGSYPSDQWIKLLNFMKETSTDDKSPIIGSEGNSYWYAYVNNSNFKLFFDISGSGGDSTIMHEFPVEEMIPVVEQIIEKIKLME